VARPTEHRTALSDQAGAIPVQGAGQPYDIIELVTADHRRIRRLIRAVQDAARYSGGRRWVLAAAWQRLAALLEVHARAEEEICYLPMFGPGSQAAGRIRELVSCHDDIRDAIGEAAFQPVDSPLWWRSVRAVLAAAAEHFDGEEHAIQSSWMPRLTMSTRRELGRQWSAFTAAWQQDNGAARAPQHPLNP
jgi:hypothetical protein